MAKKKQANEDKPTQASATIIAAGITAIASIIVAIISLSKSDGLPVSHPTATSVQTAQTGLSCEYPPRYGFECGQAGWEMTTYYKDQAIQTLNTTMFTNRNGAPSTVLELTVDFTGTIEERKSQYRESGEVQVDINAFPPAGVGTTNTDLTEKIISILVRAPKDGIGDRNSPNGVQLFVKDDQDRNCYGKWNEIKQEETWFQVTWDENAAHLCDSGFESSKPKYIGIKIALGGRSIKIYHEPLIFYVDDLNWD